MDSIINMPLANISQYAFRKAAYEILDKINIDDKKKIGLILPVTSNGKEWKSIKESFLYNLTYPGFNATLTERERVMHTFHWYIGIDPDEEIYTEESIKSFIPNSSIYVMTAEKGDIGSMWNELYHKAYHDGCDYMYQIGDDIYFYGECASWITKAIKVLAKHRNIGVTGPISHKTILKLTQCFISRRHYEIFHYLFPRGINNLGVDETTNYLYQPTNYYFPLDDLKYFNFSGPPRYVKSHKFSILNWRIMMQRKILDIYLMKHPYVFILGEIESIKAEVEKQKDCEKEDIIYIDCDLSMTDLNKKQAEIYKKYHKKEHYRNAIVLYWDKCASYVDTRIRTTINELINDNYDIVGCHSVLIKNKDDKLCEFRKDEFNSIWRASIGFKLNYLGYHKYITKTEDECSFWEFTDYPLKVIERIKIINYITHVEHSVAENDFYMQIFKRLNLFQDKKKLPNDI